MTTFQKGLVAGAGIVILFAVIAGAILGVWWLNSGRPNAVATTGQPTAEASSTSGAVENQPTSPAKATLPPRSQPVTPVARPPVQAASFGLVRDVESGQLVVDVGTETETILLGDQTVIVYAGILNATLEDIKTGDKVLAFGGTKDNLTQARLLIVAPASYTGANIVAGQIASVAGNTLTVTMRQGSRTVTTTADTRIFDPQMRLGKATNYPVGAEVIAIGDASAGGIVAQILYTGGAQVGNTAPASRPSPTPTPRK